MTAQNSENVFPFSKPTASFVAITPELAKRWLTANPRNRKIRPAAVERYRRDMLAGRWHLDGAPIRFDPAGVLLDGQHRLSAIVASGKTITMLVIRGIDPSAQSVMDTGRARTAADALAINGHQHPVMEAAVARLVIEVNTDALDFGSNGRLEISHEEIIACLAENPDIATAVAFTRQFARRTDCPPAVVAYTYFVMRRINPQGAAEFWLAVANKVGLSDGDPALALANRFAESRRNREHLPRRVLLSLIYRAWNARRAGKTMRFIRVNSPKGGLVPVPRPE